MAECADDDSDSQLVIDMDHGESGAEEDKTDNFTKVRSRNDKRKATSPLGAAEKYAVTEKNSRESSPDNADYVVYVKGTTRNLKTIAPATIRRELQSSFGKVQKIECAGNSIRIYCTRDSQKRNILKTKMMGNIAVEASEPRPKVAESQRQNTKKCVINGVPTDIQDDDICTATDATTAQRILKRDNNGVKIPTTTVILIYAGETIPEIVHIDYLTFRTKSYIPKPVRCFKCQKFGHTKDHCRSETNKCPICAKDHGYESCPNKLQLKCANCGGPHSAGYKDCPKYKESLTINKLVATTGLSYRDAAAQVKKPQIQQTETVITKTHSTDENNTGTDTRGHYTAPAVHKKPQTRMDTGTTSSQDDSTHTTPAGETTTPPIQRQTPNTEQEETNRNGKDVPIDKVIKFLICLLENLKTQAGIKTLNAVIIEAVIKLLDDDADLSASIVTNLEAANPA
jgi:hypothetical protein